MENYSKIIFWAIVMAGILFIGQGIFYYFFCEEVLAGKLSTLIGIFSSITGWFIYKKL